MKNIRNLALTGLLISSLMSNQSLEASFLSDHKVSLAATLVTPLIVSGLVYKAVIKKVQQWQKEREEFEPLIDPRFLDDYIKVWKPHNQKVDERIVKACVIGSGVLTALAVGSICLGANLLGYTF
jgi:hypothetical protein